MLKAQNSKNRGSIWKQSKIGIPFWSLKLSDLRFLIDLYYIRLFKNKFMEHILN